LEGDAWRERNAERVEYKERGKIRRKLNDKGKERGTEVRGRELK
jgi:hypothetical protein